MSPGYTAGMKIVYADTLVIVNMAVDYLLLLSAGKLCALPLRRWRMALGALWGGVYALLAAVYPGVFALWTAKLLSGALAVLIAFGPERRTPRALVAFYGVAAAFAGAVYAAAALRGEPVGAGIPVSAPVLLLSFALCYAAVSLAFRHIGRRAERQLHAVSVVLGEAEASFSALEDSGNELIDPVSGCGVLVADRAALAPLFGSEPMPPLEDPAALERLSAAYPTARFRLLPCRCVAAERALLLCFRPSELRVDGQRRDLLVAVSAGALSPDGAYQAIL